MHILILPQVKQVHPGKNLIDYWKTANVVRKIYNWYLGGLSINGIIKELEKQNISSPKGKDRWNKHSLETMLSNEKYKGDVRLLNKRIQGRSGEGKTLIIPYRV